MGRSGPRLSPAAEVLAPDVLDALRRQTGREGVLSELGVLPRSWGGPDVDQAADARGAKDVQELLHRPRAVADREQRRPGGHVPGLPPGRSPYEVALRNARVAPVRVNSPTTAMIPSALPSSAQA